MYHSSGVLTPVSFPMHLSTMQVKKDRCLKNRPCIVIAGGREPSTWEQYTNHHYIHRCGMLPCCDNGGCWKSRTYKVGDGDEEKDKSLCFFPIKSSQLKLKFFCLVWGFVVECVFSFLGSWFEFA